MDRPNIEDYKYTDGLKFRPYTEYKMATYILDLEKYCDELECIFAEREQEATDYIQKLENALDKACNMLDHAFATMGYECNVDKKWHMSMSEWKEWCLSDE